MKYVYPAIVSLSKKQGFDVNIVDIPQCSTFGDSLDDALENAKITLNDYLNNSVKGNLPIPSKISTITVPTGSFLGLVEYEK